MPLPVVTSRVIRWCVVVVCNWEEGALGDWEVAQVMLRRQLTNRGVTPGDPALGRAIRWVGCPLAFYPRLGRVENADKKTTRRRGRAEPSGVDPGAGTPQPPALCRRARLHYTRRAHRGRRAPPPACARKRSAQQPTSHIRNNRPVRSCFIFRCHSDEQRNARLSTVDSRLSTCSPVSQSTRVPTPGQPRENCSSSSP